MYVRHLLITEFKQQSPLTSHPPRTPPCCSAEWSEFEQFAASVEAAEEEEEAEMEQLMKGKEEREQAQQ